LFFKAEGESGMTQAENPKRAAIYARSATTQETGASFATDAQIQACFAYAHEKGYTIVEGQIYSEVASGVTENRQLLLAMLAAGERGEFDTLVIYDYARLARNPQLLTTLITQFEEAGITVVSIQEPFSVLSIMRMLQTCEADEQRKRIAARTKHGRQAVKERTQKPPFGYTAAEDTPAFTMQSQEAEAVQHLIAQEQ
jgi:site-specific DNA recombinase